MIENNAAATDNETAPTPAQTNIKNSDTTVMPTATIAQLPETAVQRLDFNMHGID